MQFLDWALKGKGKPSPSPLLPVKLQVLKVGTMWTADPEQHTRYGPALEQKTRPPATSRAGLHKGVNSCLVEAPVH